jgi:signal transduction histidine kinase
LGLALCRRMAKSLGGHLRFERSDHGARFVMELPKSRYQDPSQVASKA